MTAFQPTSASGQVWLPRSGNWTGLLVYLGVGVLVGSLWHAQPNVLTYQQGLWGVVAFAAYGVAYGASFFHCLHTRWRVWAVLVMSVSLVAFNWVFAHLLSFTSVSLQVVTCLAIALTVPARWALVWIVVQSCATAWANQHGIPATYALLLYPTYILMNLFAAYMMQIVLRERQQRAELSALNAELQAARDAVAASAKEAERHRIARDLHDTLGHRLTALNLELEFALQAPAAAVRESVERAQTLNSHLLAEVRETIRDVREERPESLEDSLRALGEQFPVALDVHCAAVQLDPVKRDILLKCAREALTNAVRHAKAQRICLSLQPESAYNVLRVENDVPPSRRSGVSFGQGLRGMQERLEAVGGRLRVQRRQNQFVLEAAVPVWPSGGERHAGAAGR